MTEDKASDYLLNETKQLSCAIQRVFESDDGKRLLYFLLEKSRFLNVDGQALSYEQEAYWKGAREVIKAILLHMDTEYILELMHAHIEQTRRRNQEQQRRFSV